MGNVDCFRGVFMRDTLPITIRNTECGVVNLDDSHGDGTHWVAYFRDGGHRYYFDSYGLNAPLEIIGYLGEPFVAHTFQLQEPGDVICGHLCVFVLQALNFGVDFKNIILPLI